MKGPFNVQMHVWGPVRCAGSRSGSTLKPSTLNSKPCLVVELGSPVVPFCLCFGFYRFASKAANPKKGALSKIWFCGLPSDIQGKLAAELSEVVLWCRVWPTLICAVDGYG